jgi:L-amino acid N-acyltransferase YncA
VIIRKFEKVDYLAVKNIYQQGIDTGNATFQRTAKSWDDWNTSMHKHSRIVAE